MANMISLSNVIDWLNLFKDDQLNEPNKMNDFNYINGWAIFTKVVQASKVLSDPRPQLGANLVTLLSFTSVSDNYKYSI